MFQFILDGETDPWTLLRGISHLWQRQPAFCSTIFTCSPAKQQLCRYQITKDISYGAEPPDVHLLLFFVACFCLFPLFFFCALGTPAVCKAPDSTSGLKKFQGIWTKSYAPSATWWWRWCLTKSLCVGLVTVERSRKLKLCYYGGGHSQSGLVILFHFPR